MTTEQQMKSLHKAEDKTLYLLKADYCLLETEIWNIEQVIIEKHK